MSSGFQERGRRFITTEPIGQKGEKSEQKVWDAVRETFSNRECIAYWRYPIFSKVGESRKEPDILIVDRQLGLTIIEVKSIHINDIKSINGNRWDLNKDLQYINPYQQAENQLYSLLGYCDREPTVRRKITGRILVALPLIREGEWQEQGFDRLPSCPPILFKEHLGITTLLNKILQVSPSISGSELDNEQWEILLAVISGTPILRKPNINNSFNSEIRSSVISSLKEKLYELDIQQEHIGKEIPPGIQRLRGIAGSGKTILLCQKAAHMHLKHPDWDIVFIFFTRSLYDGIIENIDKWMRRFSNGEVQFNTNNQRLKVLHAWGAKDQPGFYRTVCNSNSEIPGTVIKGMSPNEGLAFHCKTMMETLDKESKTLNQLFDAILIDEGQDLVVDENLKYQDKQAIYWLAYQSLRIIDPQEENQRRLIWAYDEAQSLDNLKIPTAKEVFGIDLSNLVKGTHKGGIKKSEILDRCYRTPGPILTAAHAIGMGLLREEGMISGLTVGSDWEKIGYEVEGTFKPPGQKVTLHRPAEKSPNLVPHLWKSPVLEFEIYDSRQEELSNLLENIRHNVNHDKLNLSREILIIVLGSTFEAIELERHVASFLMNQGIDIFIPSALKSNEVNPKWPHNDPNKFWHDGSITVSRIHRAKGNEADMVYVVGFDNVAKHEEDVTLRNQVFVALTRSRGWARLSGIGNYPMYTEMLKVIESGDRFTFIFKRPPKRHIDSED